MFHCLLQHLELFSSIVRCKFQESLSYRTGSFRGNCFGIVHISQVCSDKSRKFEDLWQRVPCLCKLTNTVTFKLSKFSFKSNIALRKTLNFFNCKFLLFQVACCNLMTNAKGKLASYPGALSFLRFN